MVAINVVYHHACLTRFHRKVDNFDVTQLRFIQLECRCSTSNLTIDNNHRSGTLMEMADLTALYNKRLVALGFPDIKCNTKHLREDIEHIVPYIKPPLKMIRAGLLSLMITWTE